jgi:hypothetical protein
MIVDINGAYVAGPLFLLSITNLAMIFAYGRLQKCVHNMQLSMISERSIMQMLLDSESIRIATPGNKTCQ